MSSTCYNVVFFVVLLSRFIYVESIKGNKADSMSSKYHIMVNNMLKNLSHRYSSHYNIKFVGFMLIYYAIIEDIIAFFMIFSILYFESINLS